MAFLYAPSFPISSGNTTTGTGGFIANNTILFIGNNTVNAYLNTVGLSVNGSLTANTTGLWTAAGTVNAASHTTGATGTGTGGVIANVTTIFVGNNTVNASLNTIGLSVNGTALVANTTGLWTAAGTVNAASHTTGATGTGTGGVIANVTTIFVGNNTVNAVLTTVGLSVNGTALVANTTGLWTAAGTVNAAVVSVGTNFIANTTRVTIAPAVAFYANSVAGTAGQVLTSTASGNIYWATASGGGATLVANNTDSQTFYIPMANTTTGTWTNAVVSTTQMYFVPSTGTLSATVFNSLSDESQKTNITNIIDPLNIVNKIRGVEFDWLSTGKKSSGVIAQEIEKLLPHLVEENNGSKSVNYSGLIAYLIESIKKLENRVVELELINKRK